MKWSMLGPVGTPLCMKTNTPLNFITSTPSIFMGFPPHSSHHFRVTSTSFTMVCQAPMETPAEFGGYSWAFRDAVGRDNISRTAKATVGTILFIDNSLYVLDLFQRNRVLCSPKGCVGTPRGRPTPHR